MGCLCAATENMNTEMCCGRWVCDENCYTANHFPLDLRGKMFFPLIFFCVTQFKKKKKKAQCAPTLLVWSTQEMSLKKKIRVPRLMTTPAYHESSEVFILD